MSNKKAVVLDQYSILTSLGDTSKTCDSLLNGKSAVVCGTIYGAKTGYMPFKNIGHRNLKNCLQTITATIDFSDINPNKTILIYGSAKGSIESIEQYVKHNELPENVPPPLLDEQAFLISNSLNFKPIRTITVSNACTSGAIAIETAKEFLEQGTYKYAIVVGFDVISEFVITGFNALGAITKDRARPFDANRDGLSLGDGGAIAILTYRNTKKGDVVISGAGSSNDANHRTGPSRTGEGLYNAIQSAFKDANIEPSNIGAVKCHGTATVYNDAMEAKAINSTFKNNCPPSVSLKGAIGHCSGGGSLIEIILASEFIKKRKLPPTAGYLDHGVDEDIGISAKQQIIEKPSILCLSAGFGGVNGAVILEEVIAE